MSKDTKSNPESEAETSSIDGEPEVDYLTLEDSFGIGSRVAYIRWITANSGPVYIPDLPEDEFVLLGALEELIERLEKSELDKPIITDIKRERERLVEEYGPFKDERIEIEDPERQTLYEATGTWLNTLKELLESEKRIRIQETSVVDTEQLNNKPASLFGNPIVWDSLSRHSQNDLEEACQAVGLGLPTASMAVSLRVVERRLREWHGILKESEDDVDRTFGQLVSEIGDHFDSNNQDPPEIWHHLKYLKERRDQVSHPDRIPDIQEAESTLMMVRETLTDLHYRIEGAERYEALTEE